MLDRKLLLSVLALAVLFTAFIALTMDSRVLAQNSCRLRASVIGAAGSRVAGSGRISSSTLGQAAPPGISTGTGTELYSGFWKSAWWSAMSGAEVSDVVRNELFQNYPNPSNPMTTIKYSMSREGSVDLVVYDVSGHMVRTLVSENRPAGIHSTVWDGKNEEGRSVATGVYFYRLRAGSFSEVKKMILLR